MIWANIKRSLKPVAATTSTSQVIDNTVTNSTRALIKQARTLRNEQRYSEACEKLLEALSAKDAKNLTIKERLLLPRYMQLAGKKEEGWELLNNMMAVNNNAAAQVEIVEQMSRYLHREGKHRHSLLYTMWKICKEIERDRLNMLSIEEVADQETASNKNLFLKNKKNDRVKTYGSTKNGSVITDPLYRMLKERISTNTLPDAVRSRVEEPLKQLQLIERAEALAASLSEYVKSKTNLQFSELKEILNAHLV